MQIYFKKRLSKVYFYIETRLLVGVFGVFAGSKSLSGLFPAPIALIAVLLQRIQDLKSRYHQSVVRASVKVNSEQLIYNFLLGRDIVEMHVEERWGDGVISQLSNDLKREMPTVEGLSVTNLRYCRRFYLLYSELVTIHPQTEGEITEDANLAIRPQLEGELSASELSHYAGAIFRVPWGHHKLILDKVNGNFAYLEK